MSEPKPSEPTMSPARKYLQQRVYQAILKVLARCNFFEVVTVTRGPDAVHVCVHDPAEYTFEISLKAAERMEAAIEQGRFGPEGLEALVDHRIHELYRLRHPRLDPVKEKPGEWAQLHGWAKLMEYLIDRARKGYDIFFDINPPEGEREEIDTDPAWADDPQPLLEYIEPHIRFLITQEAWLMDEGGKLVHDEDWHCMEQADYVAYIERVVEHLNAEFGEKFSFPAGLDKERDGPQSWTTADGRMTGPLPMVW